MGLDLVAYKASKNIAASALSGVESMTVDGQTLNITTKDGTLLPMTFPTPKDGEKGDKGDPGAAGKSPYDIAVDNGFVGTETEWLESLKGADGYTPVKGTDYFDGQDGFSPIIEENENNTDKIYKLDITTADRIFTTPNLKGADGQGGAGGSGEENVIDSISVNGVNVVPDDNKNVDIEVPNIYIGDTEPTSEGVEIWVNTSGEPSSIDILKGKKILFVGDSICYGTGLSNGQYPYPYWIGQLHPTATIINDGVAGSTICYQEPSVGDSISLKCQNDRYSGSEFVDADIVVIEGGINDLMRNKTFGTLKSGYMNIRQKYYKDDITTYAGALEYIFKYFTEKFVGKRILFTTIHRLTSAIAIDKQWAYWECASEACAKWGVEFIDLFHSIPTELTGSDLHPNNATHKDWYARIINDVLVGNRAFAVSTNKTYYGKFVTTMSALITTGYTTNVFKVGDTFSQSDWRINSGGFNGNNGSNVTSKVTWDLSDIPMDSNKVLTTAGTYYAWGWANIDGVFMDCAVPVTVNQADSESGGEEETTAELTGIGATKSKTTYTVGETLNTDDITVTGTYSDGSTKDLTNEASIDTSGVNMAADGVYVINVSVDGGYTATISITVEAASSDNVDAIFVYEADGTQEEGVARTGDLTFDAVSIASGQQYTVSYDVEVITENFDCSALQGQRWRVTTPYNYNAGIDNTTSYWGWDNIVSNTGVLNSSWVQSGSGTAKLNFSKTYTAFVNCSISSWNPRGTLDVSCSGKVTIKISNFKIELL